MTHAARASAACLGVSPCKRSNREVPDFEASLKTHVTLSELIDRSGNREHKRVFPSFSDDSGTFLMIVGAKFRAVEVEYWRSTSQRLSFDPNALAQTSKIGSGVCSK